MEILVIQNQQTRLLLQIQHADFDHVSLPSSHDAMQLEKHQFLLKYSEKYLSIAKPKYIAVT